MSDTLDATPLEISVCTLVACFDKHAGDDQKLDKNEFKKLLKEEFKHLSDAVSPQELEEMYEKLNLDGEEGMVFEEYMTMIMMVCCVFHAAASAMNQQRSM